MISSSSFWVDIALGLLLSAPLAFWGYRRQSLTRRAAAACVALVFVTSVLADWTWSLPLAAFLLSLITLSGFRAAYKRGLSDRFRQGARRDWQQVLARLLWSLMLALLSCAAALPGLTFFAFVGAIGASTADLWETELGVLGDARPVLPTNGKRVPSGRQGALSLLGTLAGFAGGWLIGLVALLAKWLQAWLGNVSLGRLYLWLPVVTMAAGIVGSLSDSLISAIAQGMYYCEHCDERTERSRHYCGHKASQIRGAAWLTNDVVNFVGSLVGAGAGMALAQWLAQSQLGW